MSSSAAVETSAATMGSATSVKSSTSAAEAASATEASSAETSAPARAGETAAAHAMRVSNEPGRAASGVVRPVARSEMVVKAASRETIAIPEEGSSENEPWRVEAPAKRVVEDSVAGDKRVGIVEGIPIPSVAIPAAGRPTASARVRSGRIDVRLRQV